MSKDLMLFLNIIKTMQTPIVHEFKELGTLQLESGKTIDSAGFENYWMRANFEALVTGATYCTVVDDYIIRRYCTILSSDPDLLDDFLKYSNYFYVFLNIFIFFAHYYDNFLSYFYPFI